MRTAFARGKKMHWVRIFWRKPVSLRVKVAPVQSSFTSLDARRRRRRGRGKSVANAIQFACFENHALPPLPSHIYPASLNARERRKKRIIVRGGRVCWRRFARRWANWVGGACEKKGGEGEAESNSNAGGCKARFVQAKKIRLV